MSKQSIPQGLYQEARKAVTDLLRYEWPERLALKQVAESGDRGECLEPIYINTARAALARHPADDLIGAE